MSSQWVTFDLCGAVVKHRTRDREEAGSVPTSTKCVLEQDALATLRSTGRKRATWKISTSLLNVFHPL